MRLGIITQQTDIARAVWLALPLHAKAPLVANRSRQPQDVTLAEIRNALQPRRER